MININVFEEKIRNLRGQALGLRIAIAKAEEDHALHVKRLNWAADLADQCAADLQLQLDQLKQVA